MEQKQQPSGQQPQLTFIRERIDDWSRQAHAFQVWICAGQGRGCKRNRFRSDPKKCDDCISGSDQKSLGKLVQLELKGEGNAGEQQTDGAPEKAPEPVGQ